MDSTFKLLPGQALGADGKTRLDWYALARLAFPFMVNSAVQAVLNTTDTWFVGRVSPAATAAIGVVYWPVLVFLLLLGGVGLSVQTVVAQAFGGRRYVRAAHATWTALWASFLTAPLFAALAFSGRSVFGLAGIEAQTLDLAVTYWQPRMLGGWLAVAVWSVLGFFNGIGRPQLTLRIAVVVAIANVVLNQLFMFNLGMGVAGSAWATNAAQLLGLVIGICWFVGPAMRARFRSHLTMRLHLGELWRQLRLGLPMGLMSAADILGFAVFQLMEVRLGTVDGASSQIVMMLTGFAYMPAVGIAMAGTTLVGQSIGAHRKDWAGAVGTRIIAAATLYMGAVGILLAALGPWFLPWFTNAADPQAPQVVRLAGKLLWIAACYQLFDGLNIGSNLCLRGAGDVRLPALMVLALSWLVFLPLAHSLAFAPGAGWVGWLPQYGLGSLGGWTAALIYILLLGVMLFSRWCSGAWRRIEL